VLQNRLKILPNIKTIWNQNKETIFWNKV